MNTRNRNGFRGFGFYAVLILVVIMIWYGLSGNTATSSYTKSDFQKALGKGDVTYVKVVQNREVPTGSLRIKLKDGSQQYLYASDINEMQSLMDDEKFDNYTIEDVPAESWIMTLLPYLLIFGAFFILFVIMNNNAAANSGGGKMMNFGKSRARMSMPAKAVRSFPQRKTIRLHLRMLQDCVRRRRNSKNWSTSCVTRRNTRSSVPVFQKAYCSSDLREPVRHCLQRRLQERLAYLSLAFPVRTL